MAMRNTIRTGSVLRSIALLAPIALAAAVLAPLATEVEANLLGGAVFRGATAGTPVPFDPIALPPVVVGASNDQGSMFGLEPGGSDEALSRSAGQFGHPAVDPFRPEFDELVSGMTVVTTDAQMNAVWNRLFDVPYNAALFDFETSFVVIVGGGLMHPFFGFEVTAVERFESTFSGPNGFGETYLEEALAMVATTFLPGPKPPEEDPVYKIGAVEIAFADRDDVVLNRQVLALP
jgi:hypothetical protein